MKYHLWRFFDVLDRLFRSEKVDAVLSVFLIISASSALAMVLVSCKINTTSSTAPKDITTEYRVDPSNPGMVITGHTSEQTANNFLEESGELGAKKIIEEKKKDVGDGETSYSYVLEEESGEQVYIDNAVVLPDDSDVDVYYRPDTGIMTFYGYKPSEIIHQEGAGDATLNTADWDDPTFID